MVCRSKILSMPVLTVAWLFFLVYPLYATPYDELIGEAFSAPDLTQEMDNEWKSKTIEYNDSDKGADIVLSLNQQFYEYIEPYVKQYAAENGLKVIVKRGTCGLSAGMLSAKTIDIGAFCCPPGRTDRLPGLQFHTLGIHPLAFLVHPDNPIENVSLGQLREVFKGDIVDWAELGWDNGRIEPVVRLHCKKRPGHWRLLLDNEDLFATSVREVGTISDMFSLIETQETTIGYEVIWLAHREAGRVKTISINGHHPDELDKVVSGEYPFYRTLYLTTWEAGHLDNPHTQRLVDFVIKQVELNGDRHGIVPVSKLRTADWKFLDNELIGSPERTVK